MKSPEVAEASAQVRALLMSVHGACLAKEHSSTLGKVILVLHLDLSHGVLNVNTLLIKFRLVDLVS